MSDLIDKKTLYKAVCRLWDKSDSEDFEKGVFEIIKNAPIIDAVEVVRCKDCKYKYMSKSVWECLYGLMITADGYCNYGEPKEIDHE